MERFLEDLWVFLRSRLVFFPDRPSPLRGSAQDRIRGQPRPEWRLQFFFRLVGPGKQARRKTACSTRTLGQRYRGASAAATNPAQGPSNGADTEAARSVWPTTQVSPGKGG